jgi:hypothetical protein
MEAVPTWQFTDRRPVEVVVYLIRNVIECGLAAISDLSIGSCSNWFIRDGI